MPHRARGSRPESSVSSARASAIDMLEVLRPIMKSIPMAGCIGEGVVETILAVAKLAERVESCSDDCVDLIRRAADISAAVLKALVPVEDEKGDEYQPLLLRAGRFISALKEIADYATDAAHMSRFQRILNVSTIRAELDRRTRLLDSVVQTFQISFAVSAEVALIRLRELENRQDAHGDRSHREVKGGQMAGLPEDAADGDSQIMSHAEIILIATRKHPITSRTLVVDSVCRVRRTNETFVIKQGKGKGASLAEHIALLKRIRVPGVEQLIAISRQDTTVPFYVSYSGTMSVTEAVRNMPLSAQLSFALHFTNEIGVIFQNLKDWFENNFDDYTNFFANIIELRNRDIMLMPMVGEGHNLIVDVMLNDEGHQQYSLLGHTEDYSDAIFQLACTPDSNGNDLEAWFKTVDHLNFVYHTRIVSVPPPSHLRSPLSLSRSGSVSRHDGTCGVNDVQEDRLYLPADRQFAPIRDVINLHPRQDGEPLICPKFPDGRRRYTVKRGCKVSGSARDSGMSDAWLSLYRATVAADKEGGQVPTDLIAVKESQSHFSSKVVVNDGRRAATPDVLYFFLYPRPTVGPAHIAAGYWARDKKGEITSTITNCEFDSSQKRWKLSMDLDGISISMSCYTRISYAKLTDAEVELIRTSRT